MTETERESDLEQEGVVTRDPRGEPAFEAFRNNAYAKTGQELLDTGDPAAVHLDLHRDKQDAVRPEALAMTFLLYPEGGVIEEAADGYQLPIETEEYRAPKTEEGIERLEAILYDYLYHPSPGTGPQL